MDKDILIFIIKLVAVHEGFLRGWKLKKNDENRLILTKKIVNLNDDDVYDFLCMFRNILNN